MSDPLSRRGIVAFLAALSAAPRAVATTAAESLREAIDETYEHPGQTVGRGMPEYMRPEKLNPLQYAAKLAHRDANKKAELRCARITACKSMSRSAKRAYYKIARDESQPVYLKYAMLMGWRAENDDIDEWA